MNTKVIIVFIVITLTSLNCRSQNTTLESFDEVYKKELFVENNALSTRIAKFPQEIKILNNEIKASIKEGDFVKAFDIGVKIDELMPNNDDVKNFLGKISTKLGYISKAEVYFDEALKINPNSKWIYINKSSLLSEIGKTTEALETINILLRKFPNWFVAYNVKGALNSTLGNKNEAIKSFSKGIKLEPKSAQILTNRGNIYLEIDKIDDAKADFEKAVSIDPNYKIAVEKLNLLNK